MFWAKNVFLLTLAIMVPFRAASALDCSQCGLANYAPGLPLDPAEFPWQAWILYKGRHFCFGALLNDRFVLAPGHCVYGSKPAADFTVVLGEHNFNPKNSQATFEVRSLDDWEGFDFGKPFSQKDMVLIRLDQVVTFTQHIRPVCIPKLDADYSGKPGTVAGWDKTPFSSNPDQPSVHTSVTVKSPSQCNKTVFNDYTFMDYHMCLGYNSDFKCYGDYRGPAYLDLANDGVYYVVGVTGMDAGNCSWPHPMRYGDVHYFLPEIQQRVNNELCYARK